MLKVVKSLLKAVWDKELVMSIGITKEEIRSLAIASVLCAGQQVSHVRKESTL
jgi:hypothetical protein